MLSRREVAFEGEHRDVLEGYRMFAHDKGWVRRLEEAIRNGLTAEAAVEKVQSDMRARMIHVTDPYLRERMNDFDDLANRLLRAADRRRARARARQAAAGRDHRRAHHGRGGTARLSARDDLRGLVLEDGAATSHVVIVARAMGIPVVGQGKGIVSLAENGDPIIVDGDDGRRASAPDAGRRGAYAEKVRFRAKRQEQYRALREGRR